MKKVLQLSLALVLSSSWIVGCTATTPHENFVEILSSRVGSKIDDFYNLRPSLKIAERGLSNGNIEYKYKYFGDCVETYEVEPTTRIIRSVSYEGSNKWCSVSP